MRALQKIECDGTFFWSWEEVEEIEPTQPIPEVPPECHNSRPVDAERCMEAIRLMCKGVA